MSRYLAAAGERRGTVRCTGLFVDSRRERIHRLCHVFARQTRPHRPGPECGAAMNSPVWPEPLRQGDPHAVGDFRLEGRLGGGGMGQVFLGRSPGGRPVAVKLVRPELAGDPGFRRRFAIEVEAARRVGGFYTAQVVEADPDADPPWLVTAYIPGPSLHQAVETHGPLPAEGTAVLGAGLAEGLRAIHACNLVHRDLKPSNVILAADGPHVIDFGITRALDATSHTLSHAVVGTPSFMSPEQARGHEIGPASDVFSLGLVLAFAATGRSPFGTGSAEAIVYRIVHDDPDLTGLPGYLADLVQRCLAKSPGDRPDVAGILRELTRPTRTTGSWLPAPVATMIAEREVQTPTALLPSPSPDSGAREDRTPGGPGNGRPGNGRPGESPSQRRRFGPELVWIGAACAVLGLLAVAVAGLDFYKRHAAATSSSPTSSHTSTPSPTRTASPTPTPTPSASSSPSPSTSTSPTPSQDAVSRAFMAVREGDCFHVGDGNPSDFVYSQPNDSLKPDVVPCDAWNAYYRVTRVGPIGPECPGPPRGGSAEWTHQGPPDVSLCVDRQFRVGDCVLGNAKGGELDSVQLLDGWDCADARFPSGYDHRVQITQILGPDKGSQCKTKSVQALHGTVTLCLKVI
ncbi:serine/threonine-protein kinase [Streptomyces sp. NPDC085524]|uniref:serine/threonine-protein kinase n=1 Tax=Streptomyces sp. NPDC085524 TaxID=3365728 RepID=UPI0037D6B992